MGGCAARRKDTDAIAQGIVDFGRGCEAAGGVGASGTELVHIAAVRQNRVKAEAERAGQRTVHDGVAGQCAAAASAAAEFGSRDVIAAAAVSGVLEHHHSDRAGDGGRPIVAAIDACERQPPGFGVHVNGEGAVILCGIGGVDSEKETRAGVGQTGCGNAQQSERYNVATLYGVLIGIHLAWHRGGDRPREGTPAAQRGIGGARAVDPRQDNV